MVGTKKVEITSAGEDMERLETSHTADGNVKWYSTLENNLAIPQKG